MDNETKKKELKTFIQDWLNKPPQEKQTTGNSRKNSNHILVPIDLNIEKRTTVGSKKKSKDAAHDNPKITEFIMKNTDKEEKEERARAKANDFLGNLFS